MILSCAQTCSMPHVQFTSALIQNLSWMYSPSHDTVGKSLARHAFDDKANAVFHYYFVVMCIYLRRKWYTFHVKVLCALHASRMSQLFSLTICFFVSTNPFVGCSTKSLQERCFYHYSQGSLWSPLTATLRMSLFGFLDVRSLVASWFLSWICVVSTKLTNLPTMSLAAYLALGSRFPSPCLQNTPSMRILQNVYMYSHGKRKFVQAKRHLVYLTRALT